MAARKAIKSVDWASIAARVTEADRPIFAAFRSKSDGFLRRMEQYPETAPAIDWAFYKKAIPGSMVDSFQKEYDSLKVPYPADNYTATLETKGKEIEAKIQAFMAESKSRMDKFSSEIARINSLLPFDQMTMEDFAEAYPDIAWNPEKPTLFPHIPEWQPGDEPEKIPEPEH